MNTPSICRGRGVAIFGAASALIIANSSAVIIDDFSSGGQLVFVNTSNPFATDSVAAPSAIGGSRTVDLALNPPTDGNGLVLIDPSAGLGIGGVSLTGQMDIIFSWNPGGVDLTAGGINDALFLDFASLDPGSANSSLQFDFVFTSISGDMATLSTSVFSIPPNPSAFTLNFGNAVYSPGPSNSAFTDTDSIAMNVFTGSAADFAISKLETGTTNRVPDTGSTLLLFGMVIGVGGVARRSLRANGRQTHPS